MMEPWGGELRGGALDVRVGEGCLNLITYVREGMGRGSI